MPRTKVVKEKANYIHAECRTRFLRFVDDLEFLFEDNDAVIHVRSASRVGYSDLGVNRKRVEQFRKDFEMELAKSKEKEKDKPGKKHVILQKIVYVIILMSDDQSMLIKIFTLYGPMEMLISYQNHTSISQTKKVIKSGSCHTRLRIHIQSLNY